MHTNDKHRNCRGTVRSESCLSQTSEQRSIGDTRATKLPMELSNWSEPEDDGGAWHAQGDDLVAATASGELTVCVAQKKKSGVRKATEDASTATLAGYNGHEYETELREAIDDANTLIITGRFPPDVVAFVRSKVGGAAVLLSRTLYLPMHCTMQFVFFASRFSMPHVMISSNNVFPNLIESTHILPTV